MSKTLYHLIRTELGWLPIAGSDGRIAGMYLPFKDRLEAESAIKEGIKGELVETEHDFSGEAERLAAYFAGERVKFRCELDFTGAGEFDRLVWNAAREIGYGDVETYGSVAARIGRPYAARAVGQALGRNPIPLIVPCHRVIRTDGSLGGFSCGLHWKIKMLEIEGHSEPGSRLGRMVKHERPSG